MLYGPYLPADETDYAKLTDRAERGDCGARPIWLPFTAAG